MAVVRLPGGEEHRNARAQRGEDAGLGGAEAHGGRFEKRREGAVERVDAMVEKLAESARRAGAPCLLAIDIVHGLVHEEAEREADVEP